MRSSWTLLVLATLAAAAAPSAAAAPPRSAQRLGRGGPQRIVGGEPTTIEDYPYMANMQYGWFGVWWFQACGGAVLTSSTVLSAGHCFYGDSPSDWRVRLGSSFPESGGVVSDVLQMILHPEYHDQMLDNDVAIVRLATPATFGPTIAAALVAGPDYVLPDGTAVLAAGFGYVQDGGPAADQLQHVQVYTINRQVCHERYEHLRTQPGFLSWPRVTEGMVCAGMLDAGGRDACDGDSGGPLVHGGNVVYGVTSWGYSCADAHYPGVYLAVSRFTNWIVENGST